MQKETEVLSIKNLFVKYETDDATVYAVNGLDLSLKQKQTLGLVGETGAGKTTTGLAIMRLIPNPPGIITSGMIEVNGRDIMNFNKKELREFRGKEVAMIFQDPMTSLNPVMTVGKQITEAIVLHEDVSYNKAENLAKEMLKMVGIPEDRFDDYPHQFSGGMKQRVVIAIALSCKPQILIADEPTTALDVTIQAQVLELINNLKEKVQTSTIMITHDLGIVAETCDEVAVMYAGQIVEQGTIDEVFFNTKHPYTEGLLNSLPDLNNKNCKLTPIKGLTPDPTILRKGCSFADRCPYALPECNTINQEMMKIKGSHYVRCGRSKERSFVLKRIQK